jgi:glycosyltransferase involved in cell wall biosynthesis
LEILVADNGSTDDTERLVKTYGDPRIRYFRHERNIIPNDNFNFCLEQAQGDYFLLLLDDEQIDGDFVESCLRAVEYRTGVGLIRTGVRVVDAGGAVVRQYLNDVGGLPLDEFFFGWFDNRTTIYLCGTLFSTRELRDVGGFRSRHNLFQDVVALFRIASRASRVDVREVRATTRKHSDQRTYSVTVVAWCEESLDLLDLMCRLAPQRQSEIRSRGKRFFNGVNYDRAAGVGPLASRIWAFWHVYRTFDRQQSPSAHVVFRGTLVYRVLKGTRRTLRGAIGRIARQAS